MNFDVQTLRWYIAVAEELHFARAAKSLNIARTKLSAAVIDLEDRLGHSLFVPGASPTRLTQEGSVFLVTARELVDEDDRLRAEEAALLASKQATLTVGYTEGVTPTKWTRIWAERFPDVALELVPSTIDSQSTILDDGIVDVAFVRMPVDPNGLSVIGLYEEVPVVVVPKDHAVAAFERISIADLADEHLLNDADTVPEWFEIATEVADGTRLPVPPIATNDELIEYVAAGLGLAIVPQSIARLHARKDLVYRPVDGVAGSPVAIAWPTGATTENVEEFVGIVRGRSVRSSRGSGTEKAATAKKPTVKKPAVKKPAATKARQGAPAAKSRRAAPARGKRPKR